MVACTGLLHETGGVDHGIEPIGSKCRRFLQVDLDLLEDGLAVVAIAAAHAVIFSFTGHLCAAAVGAGGVISPLDPLKVLDAGFIV